MRTSEAFTFYGILNICSAWYWAMPGEEACRWGTGADDDLRDRVVIVAFVEDFPFQPGQFLTITSRSPNLAGRLEMKMKFIDCILLCPVQRSSIWELQVLASLRRCTYDG